MSYLNNHSIGGFINHCSLVARPTIYDSALRLNSGRNCLLFLIEFLKIDKIYLPYYTCEKFKNEVNKHCDVIYYHVNHNLEPEIEIPEDDYFVYVNYFGVKDGYIDNLNYKKNLIIDCCQAFYSDFNCISFYSPRKFFPVTDGGYLSFNSIEIRRIYEKLPFDDHCSSYDFLYENTGDNLESYFKYKDNEKEVVELKIKKMSIASQSLLDLIDFEKVRKIRLENFMYLHKKIGHLNELNVDIKSIGGPMIYPLLTSKCSREDMIKNKVFVAHYWENVDSSFNVAEQYLAENLVALPIDHRYSTEHMEKIVNLIGMY
ncbi:hypothetical protein [Piscirickettsia salmonis]|uniref:hypothetical protein n=1 Tax=Piscirickettsia salmonis TaxID=1238 RepID=UPI0007C9928F|nr:hypothetical protein A0O36_01205 [Piscirickettsiaceae bacterium NZ-RLO1]